MFSSKVDLPIPVFPITYMWRGRSPRLIPKRVFLLRKSASAKYVISSLFTMRKIYVLKYNWQREENKACFNLIRANYLYRFLKENDIKNYWVAPARPSAESVYLLLGSHSIHEVNPASYVALICALTSASP